MLTVLTTSTADKLATLASLKANLGITTTSDDDQLTEHLAAASQAIIDELGYWPLRQRYSETVGGYGDLTLMLKRTPIRYVNRIMVGSQLVDPTTYTIDNAEAGVISRDQGWPWTAGIEWDLDAHVQPKSERKRFTVDYEAGWILSTETPDANGFLTNSPTGTVPPSIVQATLITARAFWLSKRRDPLIQSKSVGDLSITYSKNPVKTGIPGDAMGLIERWKRYA